MFYNRNLGNSFICPTRSGTTEIYFFGPADAGIQNKICNIHLIDIVLLLSNFLFASSRLLTWIENALRYLKCSTVLFFCWIDVVYLETLNIYHNIIEVWQNFYLRCIVGDICICISYLLFTILSNLAMSSLDCLPRPGARLPDNPDRGLQPRHQGYSCHRKLSSTLLTRPSE